MKRKYNQYQIDEWLFLPETSELISKNERKTLPTKVVEVLVILCEANGQVVSKKQLLEIVWKDILVTENSLDKIISLLRKSLNDSRNDSKYIKTVSKKGYCLIPSVKKEIIDPRPLIVKKKRSLFLYFTLVLMICVFFILNKKELKSTNILSPDGKSFVYFTIKNDNYILTKTNIFDGSEVKLDTIKNPESIAVNWSSNSNNIIYNITQKEQEYYSLKIYDLMNSKFEFIKFLKNKKNNISEIFPNISDSSSTYLEHSTTEFYDNMVHFISINKNDTIKVLFREGLIEDFKW